MLLQLLSVERCSSASWPKVSPHLVIYSIWYQTQPRRNGENYQWFSKSKDVNPHQRLSQELLPNLPSSISRSTSWHRGCSISPLAVVMATGADQTSGRREDQETPAVFVN